MKEQNVFEIIGQKFANWGGEFVEIFPYLAVAVIIFIFFIFIAKISKKITIKVLNKLSISKAVSQLISNFILVNVFLGGIIIALSVMKLDKTVTSLLAGAGIIGLALGIAFQDLVTNIISGVLIAIRKPFNIGDFIETNGIFGNVLDIRLRTTEIHNLNGQIVYIPSREVLRLPVINYSRVGKRRIVIDVGISYKEDLNRVKEITLNAIKTIPELLPEEQVEFYYKEFGESSINFMVRFWIKFKLQRDYRKAVSDSIICIKSAFDDNGITIPFPIRTLDFDSKQIEKVTGGFNKI